MNVSSNRVSAFQVDAPTGTEVPDRAVVSDKRLVSTSLFTCYNSRHCASSILRSLSCTWLA
jgi:hypothetical protein